MTNAYTYDVYGETRSATGAQDNEFQFAGQQVDSTGIQYLRARYYDMESGVFLSRDPLAALPGWGGHPFGYAGANPASVSDPSGLIPWDGSGPTNCSPECWWYTTSISPVQLHNIDPDNPRPTIDALGGFWFERRHINGEPTTDVRVCRLVGEYKRCNDTDSETSDLWSDAIGSLEEAFLVAAELKANSAVWKSFQPYKGSVRYNGLDGSRRNYYQWDYTHQHIEVYDRNCKHLGAMDASTGLLIPGSKVPPRTLKGVC